MKLLVYFPSSGLFSVLESKPKKRPQDMVRICETYVALAECFSAAKNFESIEKPLKKAWAIAKNSKGLLEHQFAIQLIWAETSRMQDRRGAFKKHFASAEHLKTKYKIHPTPIAQKKLDELRKAI